MATRTRGSGRRRSAPTRRPLGGRSRKKSKLGGCLTTLAVIVFGGFFVLKAFLGWANPYLPASWETCKVTGKDRTATADAGHSDARVYTKQCGVLIVKDAMLRGNTRSADLYGDLHRGKTYRIKHAGIRNGHMSLFPVILDVKKAKKS